MISIDFLVFSVVCGLGPCQVLHLSVEFMLEEKKEREREIRVFCLLFVCLLVYLFDTQIAFWMVTGLKYFNWNDVCMSNGPGRSSFPIPSP